MAKLFVVACVLLVIGCSTLGTWETLNDAEWDRFETKITAIKIGETTQNDIAEMFPHVTKETGNIIGTLETNIYHSEGYLSVEFWIGYRSYPTSTVVCITCVNGVVKSIYWP